MQHATMWGAGVQCLQRNRHRTSADRVKFEIPRNFLNGATLNSGDDSKSPEEASCCHARLGFRLPNLLWLTENELSMSLSDLECNATGRNGFQHRCPHQQGRTAVAAVAAVGRRWNFPTFLKSAWLDQVKLPVGVSTDSCEICWHVLCPDVQQQKGDHAKRLFDQNAMVPFFFKNSEVPLGAFSFFEFHCLYGLYGWWDVTGDRQKQEGKDGGVVDTSASRGLRRNFVNQIELHGFRSWNANLSKKMYTTFRSKTLGCKCDSWFVWCCGDVVEITKIIKVEDINVTCTCWLISTVDRAVLVIIPLDYLQLLNERHLWFGHPLVRSSMSSELRWSQFLIHIQGWTKLQQSPMKLKLFQII